jgi:hypothetical protein
MRAVDNHSGIAQYWFAIGTSSGNIDFQDWTATNDTFFTINNIQLVVGNTYFVSVKAENGAGLLSSVSSSDGLYIDTVAEIISSIDIFSENELSIFPNPAKDIFYINITDDEAKDYTVSIYDLNGKLLFQQKPDHNISISTVSLSKGIYLVAIKNAEQQWFRKLSVMK